MGELVWAACVSHAGGQLRIRRVDGEEQERIDRVYAGWEQLRSSLETAAPDVLIMVGTDHFQSFSYDLMPVFAVGRGAVSISWGEFGTGSVEVAGMPELSGAIHAHLVAKGFDVAGSAEMRLDHAYSCPLALLATEHQIPVVPLFVNSFVPPLPPLARCRALGSALRDAIERQQLAGRVAIAGTGGISHWVGVPQTGRINPEFDRGFLADFEKADVEALDMLDDERLVREGGPGAGELRCWMVALGAAGSRGARTLVYEPVDAWITGISLVEVTVS